MDRESNSRRLAAILSADMVDYSRLMEVDETGTLDALKELLDELIRPELARHNGRVVKTTGDGVLVEFGSVVDAVSSAISIQRSMIKRNTQASDENRIHFRVGINLGDVLVDDGDIFGDGVNVASRLEQLCEPDGIYVSGTAFDQLKGKLEVGYENLGHQQVKNISEPVRVYRVLLEEQNAGIIVEKKSSLFGSVNATQALLLACSIVILAAAGWYISSTDRQKDAVVEGIAPQGMPSIAVLPFDNLSDDKSQDYFADGIAEDIITDLSKISGLFVVARNTSFQYRGNSLNLPKVGRELRVRHLLEGSVRRAGNKIRINAQLIETETGGHVWAERYDGDITDVFAAQDKVTRQIIEALRLELSPTEQKAIESRGTDNPAAYDAYLQGVQLLSERRKLDIESNKLAQNAFARAIRLDPSYALAHAGLAWAKWLSIETINMFDGNLKKEAFTIANKSIELGDNALARRTLARQHFSLMNYWVFTTKRMDLAVSELRAATQLASNDPDAMADLSIALSFSGHPDEATRLINRAMERNPKHPAWYYAASGIGLLFTGKPRDAASDLKRWSDSRVNYNVPYIFLASALALSGKQKEANAALARFDLLSNTLVPTRAEKEKETEDMVPIRTTLYAIKRRWPMNAKEEAIFFEGLQLAGMTAVRN